MTEAPVHVPVMLAEVMGLLDVPRGGRVIDATIDGGGHAAVLLEHIGPTGSLLGIDRDPDMAAAVQERLAEAARCGRLRVATGSFGDLGEIAARFGFAGVQAILFDLGLSSHHLDHSGRGFSIRGDEPLDLRFDPADATRPTAADILARRSAAELTELFRDYGEERFASRVARSVVAHRQREPLATTAQLVEIVTQVLPGKERGRAGRSAARIFQALRIAVNDEIDTISAALPQAVELLAPSGRIAVISFHSLEDRIVKRFFLEQQRVGRLKILTKRPLRPSDDEIRANPRSASAKLRVAERV